MTDGLKEVNQQKDSEDAKRPAGGQGASCCSSSCCGTAETDKADPIT